MHDGIASARTGSQAVCGRQSRECSRGAGSHKGREAVSGMLLYTDEILCYNRLLKIILPRRPETLSLRSSRKDDFEQSVVRESFGLM